jgi:hypothetical protein
MTLTDAIVAADAAGSIPAVKMASRSGSRDRAVLESAVDRRVIYSSR